MGFKGEICFVKPGYAFNDLVPKGYALLYTDPRVKAFQTDIPALSNKQAVRAMEIFLSKLKDIRLVFVREVSEINKSVSKKPAEVHEVLEQLNKRYNMGIRKEDFKMESAIDTIGEHLVHVTYHSEQYDKDFAFFVKV